MLRPKPYAALGGVSDFTRFRQGTHMHTLRSLRRKMWTLGALIALSGGTAQAQPQLDDQPPKNPAPGPMADAKPAANGEQRYAFEMRDKRWLDVLEWLADKTKLPVNTPEKPEGTFTYIGVRMGTQAPTYSIPEIIDIINEGLETKKFLLVRQYSSFTLLAIDDQFKAGNINVPDRTIEDLPKCGRTELVRITLTLKSLNAEEFAFQARQMLSKFGSVVAIPQTNQLLLSDKAGTLVRFVNDVQAIEKGEKGGATHLDYVCKWIHAREAERTLKEMYGLAVATAALAPQASGGGTETRFGFDRGGFDRARGGFDRGGFDRGGFDRGGFTPDMGGAFDMTRMFDPRMRGTTPQQSPTRGMPIHVSCDERTNTVFIIAPADKVALGKSTLEKIDVPTGDSPKRLDTGGQNPRLVTYPVTVGVADAVARTLSDKYRDSRIIQIAAVGNNSIMVWATPNDQFQIAEYIKGVNEGTGAGTTANISVVGDAADVVSKLTKMYGDSEKTQGVPTILADTNTNAVIVKGTAAQVSDVRNSIHIIEGTTPGPAGSGGAAAGIRSNERTRVIYLDKGGAAALAAELEKNLSLLPKNPVRIQVPGQTEEQPKKEEPKKPIKPMDKPDARLNTAPNWHTAGTTPQNRDDGPILLVTDPPQ